MIIYRLTITKRNPEYWQNKKRTKIVTEKALRMTLTANRFDAVTIERATVGDFTDVTSEFLTEGAGQ